jgi:hypothetical protein
LWPKQYQKEINMSTILRSALVAAAVLVGASSAMAAPSDYRSNYGNSQYGSSNDSNRSFWDAQQRNGS